jgi:capsular exopolysaccharide synthesis family protein
LEPKNPSLSAVAQERPSFRETLQAVDTEALSNTLAPVALAALTPGSPVAEEFRSLWARIRSIGDERPFRAIGFVSAGSGEGKTTMAIGLACVIAREPNRRVLLIEADLRRPMVNTYLGIFRAPGLGEWLIAKDNEVPLRRLTPMGVSLLPAGLGPAERPEMLGSERMARLIEAARGAFDFVIVDCPPLMPVADAAILQDLLDGYLLVVRARRSPREAIQRAVSGLKPGRIQGVILNDCSEILPSYYRYAYSQFGKYR